MATLVMSRDSIIQPEHTVETYVKSFIAHKTAQAKADEANASLTEDELEVGIHYSVLAEDYTEEEFYS